MCVLYFAYCLPNFHDSRGMATEARSNNMGSRRLAPPVLDNNIPYRSWKNKLQMWTLVCGVEKKE